MSSRFWQGQDVEDAPRAAAWLNELEAQAYGGSSSLAPRTLIQPLLAGTTFITRFQSGHGWTLSAGSGAIADDATTPSLWANQSVKVTAAPSGTVVYAQKSGLALDLTTNPLVVWIKWDTATPELDFNYPAFTVFAGDAAFTNIYTWKHYLGGPATPTGQPSVNVDGWTAYELFLSDATVTGAPTKAAIDTIRIRLENQSGVSYLGGIGTRVLPTTPYPNGVITISFDDSVDNTFSRAAPILDKYGFNAVAYTICDQVGGTNRMTLAQLRQLQDYHGWEIGGHAFTKANHDATGAFPGLSAAALTSEFQGMKKWLLDNGFVSDAWASPHGLSNATVWDTARQYFNTHRSVGGPGGALARVAYLQSPKPVYPAQIWCGAFATTDYTVAVMQAMITAVASQKSWGHLCFHDVITSASSGESIQTTDLDTICASIQSAGCAVRTVKQVLALA